MRTRFATIIFAVLFYEIASAQNTLLFRERTASGVTLEYYVSTQTLESTPSWSPLREDPPLSLRSVAAIASARVAPGNPEEVRIVGFDLRTVGTSGGRRWYYAVTLYEPITGQERFPNVTKVVVLMDGTVVDATEAGK